MPLTDERIESIASQVVGIFEKENMPPFEAALIAGRALRIVSDKSHATKENERKQCPVCARETEDHWNFCVYCGTQIKGEIVLREYTQPYQSE